jgi:hypothetical protein
MAKAHEVFGVFGPAFDAAAVLGDHVRRQAFAAQAAQDLDGRDEGVATGATGMWSSVSGASLRSTRALRAKRVARGGVVIGPAGWG